MISSYSPLSPLQLFGRSPCSCDTQRWLFSRLLRQSECPPHWLLPLRDTHNLYRLLHVKRPDPLSPIPLYSPVAVVNVVEMAILWRLSFWLRTLTVYTVPLCKPLSWCSTEFPDSITVTVTLGAVAKMRINAT